MLTSSFPRTPGTTGVDAMKPVSTLLPFLILVLLLTACQGPPRQPGEPGLDARPPASPLPETPPPGQWFQVDGTRSEIRIITYPEGRLGHTHVIGGQALSGEFVIPENHHDLWLSLVIRVDALAVDEPAWRTDEGLDPDMTERAISGTRENMRSPRVLNAREFPVIRIRAAEASGPPWQSDVPAHITLAGETREVMVPVSLHRSGPALEATGRFRIRQTSFGIEPFSALGGVLRVADEVLIRFRIHARTDGPP